MAEADIIKTEHVEDVKVGVDELPSQGRYYPNTTRTDGYKSVIRFIPYLDSSGSMISYQMYNIPINTFKKGQKIICINNESISGNDDNNIAHLLIKNQIYTVCFTDLGGFKEKIELEESIYNEEPLPNENYYDRMYRFYWMFYRPRKFNINRFEKYVIKDYEDYTIEQLTDYDFQKNLLTEYPERYKDIEPYLIGRIKEEFKEIVEMFN